MTGPVSGACTAAYLPSAVVRARRSRRARRQRPLASAMHRGTAALPREHRARTGQPLRARRRGQPGVRGGHLAASQRIQDAGESATARICSHMVFSSTSVAGQGTKGIAGRGRGPQCRVCRSPPAAGVSDHSWVWPGLPGEDAPARARNTSTSRVSRGPVAAPRWPLPLRSMRWPWGRRAAVSSKTCAP